MLHAFLDDDDQPLYGPNSETAEEDDSFWEEGKKIGKKLAGKDAEKEED